MPAVVEGAPRGEVLADEVQDRLPPRRILMDLLEGQQDLGDVVPRLEVDFNVADRDLSEAGLGIFGVAHDEFSQSGLVQ